MPTYGFRFILNSRHRFFRRFWRGFNCSDVISRQHALVGSWLILTAPEGRLSEGDYLLDRRPSFGVGADNLSLDFLTASSDKRHQGILLSELAPSHGNIHIV